MDEFDWIARLLRPLAQTPEARGLLDDVAVVPSRPGFDLVLTKDAIVEGVHFLPTDPLDLVARKLLRVNLSDLAAKGATPCGYLLAIAWPPWCGEPDRTAFADGLRVDQAAYGLSLFGGDTVSTPGPLTASATLLGWVPAGTAVSRAGARPGDGVYVTGVIGDGGLGLRAARGELDALGAVAVERLADRYRLPRPRCDLAEGVRRIATASADVSDGLLADAGHIAQASGVRIALDLQAVPLSPDARAWVADAAAGASRGRARGARR
jgi:thiamine-monophosphate kinase